MILHDQDGWAESNDAVSLANAIERFSERDLVALGQAAAARAAAQYSWPHVFERLLCIYREVCAHYRKSCRQ